MFSGILKKLIVIEIIFKSLTVTAFVFCIFNLAQYTLLKAEELDKHEGIVGKITYKNNILHFELTSFDRQSKLEFYSKNKGTEMVGTLLQKATANSKITIFSKYNEDIGMNHAYEVHIADIAIYRYDEILEPHKNRAIRRLSNTVLFSMIAVCIYLIRRRYQIKLEV